MPGVDDFFADDGPIARALGDAYEPRPQQREMARAVESALASRGRLMVEAGTGVGKSFAYLLPAALAAARRSERVVIATNTIALQEQVLGHDLPMVGRILRAAGSDETPTATLVKGRSNYISIRRLRLASRRQDALLTDAAQRRTLHAIEDWAYDTADGTLATAPALERPAVWERVVSDAGNCMGRRCPTYKACFFQRARRAMEGADLLVCNHAVLCSDLALRRRGVSLLPEYDHVIIDEAHALEDVATDHFGLSVADGRVRHLLASLYDARKGRGLLASLALAPGDPAAESARGAVVRAQASADLFFDRVAALAQDAGRRDGPGVSRRLRDDDDIDDMLGPALKDLALHLIALRDRADRDEDRFELTSFIERARALADEAAALCGRTLEGCAYWAEARVSGRGVRATLACSPVDVGPALRDTLFREGRSVVLTSATLTTGGGSFRHAAERLGCDEPATLALGSPFDLSRQVDLFVEAGAPAPGQPGYADAIAERSLAHIDATDGGAFVLFTSYALMNRVVEIMEPALARRGMPVLVQGRDAGRGAMLESFRLERRGVLFGAASFWQGVDVRGDSLRNVILTRLPFDPPDRPIVEARAEALRSRGADPFKTDALPRAVIRFKQGFGRLIRSAEDRGRVVVLDPRLVTKWYGRAFLAALPEGVVERMRVERRAPTCAEGRVVYPDT
ncbi:MAG: helicase [Planctomycetota bacterium]|nr:MAG: helicase [Planctomycetota bacterium]